MSESVTTGSDGAQRDRLDRLFTCLASSERRFVVTLVSRRDPEPVPRRELATALAARKSDKPHREVTDEERQQAAARLHHRHLPRLTDAGLIEHDTEDGAVGLSDHPAFQDQGILDVVADTVPATSESLDTLFDGIAEAHRRDVVDVLSHQFGPIHVETLARELEASGRDVRASEVPETVVDRIQGRLLHVELPALSEAGLVEYDPAERTVAYAGHPQLRVPWMHSVLQPEFRQSLTGESDPEGVGEIEGRERVISFGQSLCDRADEELFCMFTDTQLLEAGCLNRIRDAARERGVNVYLGTRDPTVQEYVEGNAPEVVLWEPNTDWLNIPVAGDRVGRMLLADREAVMLGTLLEERRDGLHEEQAIVGEGEHNTLVTMICQLLGPHLEEIDEDADDIEARLPV
jgi:hypothetical protein